jgi:para-nitrobenzyl esterase
MVWIHGGGFSTGAGYPFVGATLVKKGNVIVVTINYRLGPFGFLSIPGLAAENTKGASGDYGIMDQQAALRWVKANIDRFGGDRDNVTIFGQSAGGGSVTTHLASPTSAGLFDRAIVQSGPSGADTKEVSYKKGEAIVAAAGCASSDPAAEVACMRALSVPALLAVGGASLTIDGVTLKATPRDAFTSGQFNRVPVMQGCNQWEGRSMAYPAFDLSGRTLTPEMYATAIVGQFGSAGSSVLAQYPVSNYPTPIEAFSAVMGDSMFACPTRTQIRALDSQGVRVYAYEFTEPNPPLPFPVPLGPAHSSEILFVFQDSIGFASPAQFTGNQLELSDQMLSYWTNFAHRANPNWPLLPLWTEYRNTTDLFMELTSVSPGPGIFRTFSDEHHCDFWAALGR